MQSRELGEVRGWFCRGEYWMDDGIAVLLRVLERIVCYTTRRNLDMATYPNSLTFSFYRHPILVANA